MNKEYVELSWEEYRYFLAQELERISRILEHMSDQVQQIEKRQAAAEARSKVIGSIYGLGAGAAIEVGKAVIGMIKK